VWMQCECGAGCQSWCDDESGVRQLHGSCFHAETAVRVSAMMSLVRDRFCKI
jgi:hypothetical protein